LQDFTLSDGSVIPKGVHVAVPHLALMFDKDIYGPGADRFDAFRFSKLQSETDQKQDFVHCSPNFLHFG
jgi:cytochrome P450